MTAKKKIPRFSRKSAEDRKLDLVEAGLACLARGGILHFTVDNICREAQVSKGLVVHHFGSKEELAAAVYAAAYDRMLAPVLTGEGASNDLHALVEGLFNALPANKESLRIWLALWGEISSNPGMQLEHRKYYALYRESVAGAVSAEARRRGIAVDSYEVAAGLIALVDGVWLQQCLDPTRLRNEEAKALCLRYIENSLSPRPMKSPDLQG